MAWWQSGGCIPSPESPLLLFTHQKVKSLTRTCGAHADRDVIKRRLFRAIRFENSKKITVHEMNRSQLDKISIDQLQEGAQKFDIPLTEDPNALIDVIMSFYEKALVQRKTTESSASFSRTTKPQQ
ncbi:hypothetical protein G5I_09259 [Acromyrmex echinatior]|uniref:Uncharacterized protein n=1 Tax=Acromyrmex echinatior TaxID=103372 RepID=F4WTQ9_ACREC|nr:hypothetical protein G5I_09259 [Acromyrmex echinatior]